MRIACLQFNPELGKHPENITRADALLQAASPQDIDLLVLPELAFTGTSSSLCTPSFFPTSFQSIDHYRRLQLPLPYVHIAPPRTHCRRPVYSLGKKYSNPSQLHRHSRLPGALHPISQSQHRRSRSTARGESHSVQLHRLSLPCRRNPSPLPQDAPLLHG